jgi:hypothetical protein
VEAHHRGIVPGIAGDGVVKVGVRGVYKRSALEEFDKVVKVNDALRCDAMRGMSHEARYVDFACVDGGAADCGLREPQRVGLLWV